MDVTNAVYSRTIYPSEFCRFFTLCLLHMVTDVTWLRASHIISSNIWSITPCLMCWIALGYISQSTIVAVQSELKSTGGWQSLSRIPQQLQLVRLQVSNIAIYVWCKPINFWTGYDRLIQKNTKITSL